MTICVNGCASDPCDVLGSDRLRVNGLRDSSEARLRQRNLYLTACQVLLTVLRAKSLETAGINVTTLVTYSGCPSAGALFLQYPENIVHDGISHMYYVSRISHIRTRYFTP